MSPARVGVGAIAFKAVCCVAAPVPPLPIGRAVPSTSVPIAPVWAKKFVDDAVVANKVVVVALAPVALVNVNACNVEDPVTSRLVSVARPDALIERSDAPVEERISKRFATWLAMPRSKSGVAAVDVASTVRTAVPPGFVVPIDDCPVPLTAPATCANAAAVICWRGESISDETLSEETSTCKYTELDVNAYVSASR